MSTAVLRLQAKAIQRKAASLQAVKFNVKAISVLLACACAVMLVFYIYEVNQLTQGSFLIKNYNKQVKALMAENRDLQTNFAQASFWGGVEDKAQSLDFEKTAGVAYVKITQDSLAVAK